VGGANWFFGDALANLVITPLLLCLALDWREFIKARPMRYLEGFILFGGMFFTIHFAYQRGLNNPGVLDLNDYIHDIDVILLDLTIPGAGSHKVAEEAHRIRPATKIVITSAYSQEAGSDFLKLPQVVAYIRKPFQADELVRLLRETVLRSPAEQDSRKTRHGIP